MLTKITASEDLLHPTECELCGGEFMSDGYVWLCTWCSTKPKDCLCGSDDVLFDWHVALDYVNPFWLVECQACESSTSRLETAYGAWREWDSRIDCPMCGPQPALVTGDTVRCGWCGCEELEE